MCRTVVQAISIPTQRPIVVALDSLLPTPPLLQQRLTHVVTNTDYVFILLYTLVDAQGLSIWVQRLQSRLDPCPIQQQQEQQTRLYLFALNMSVMSARVV